jgi:hypothetical protein
VSNCTDVLKKELMKKIILSIFILFVNGMFAQNSVELSPIQKEIYTLENIQVAPEFPKGEKKFDEYVKANFNNQKAKKGSEIVATFIVEMDGSITNVEIIKDDKFGSGKGLKKVLEMSPKWLEGQHKGYHVRTKLNYTLKL